MRIYMVLLLSLMVLIGASIACFAETVITVYPAKYTQSSHSNYAFYSNGKFEIVITVSDLKPSSYGLKYNDTSFYIAFKGSDNTDARGYTFELLLYGDGKAIINYYAGPAAYPDQYKNIELNTWNSTSGVRTYIIYVDHGRMTIEDQSGNDKIISDLYDTEYTTMIIGATGVQPVFTSGTVSIKYVSGVSTSAPTTATTTANQQMINETLNKTSETIKTASTAAAMTGSLALTLGSFILVLRKLEEMIQ